MPEKGIPMIVSAEETMPKTGSGDGAGEKQGDPDGIKEFQRQQTRLKTSALQDAIFNSAYFSSIATDEKGVIQIFNKAYRGRHCTEWKRYAGARTGNRAG
jgi:hypothetical protein